MAEKLITLERWAHAKYGDDAPFIGTLRRWARDGKIYPAPRKHGRAYFLPPNAEYVDDFKDTNFLSKVRDATQTQ